MKNPAKIKIFATLFAFLCAFSIQAQKTYLVCVGLNNYESNDRPLPCSRNDANAIGQFFKKYNNSEVFMLVDDNATRDHILRVIKHQFAKSTPKDEIIFAYSGHGFDGGVTCYEKGAYILYTEIQDILRTCKARRKVMLINACHSGSFSKNNPQPRPKRSYKSNNSEVMLVLSSRANEYSWESSGMRTSFFFNRLLKAFGGEADKNADRKITARELFNYIGYWVPQDTGGQQHPQMFGRFPDDMVVVYVND